MSRTAEPLRDQFATIIQAGFIAQNTSDEIAGAICYLLQDCKSTVTLWPPETKGASNIRLKSTNP